MPSYLQATSHSLNQIWFRSMSPYMGSQSPIELNAREVQFIAMYKHYQLYISETCYSVQVKQIYRQIWYFTEYNDSDEIVIRACTHKQTHRPIHLKQICHVVCHNFHQVLNGATLNYRLTYSTTCDSKDSFLLCKMCWFHHMKYWLVLLCFCIWVYKSFGVCFMSNHCKSTKHKWP